MTREAERQRPACSLWTLAAATVMTLAPGTALTQSATLAQANAHTLDYRLQPRKIAAGTWVIEGAVDDFSRANGCNIINTGFIATAAGVIVINTGPSRLYGEQQRRAIADATSLPVARVLNLNLHPDYFFGNQAYADVPTQALAGSIRGMLTEGKAYEDNLYRLCGDWMKGSAATPATVAIEPGRFDWGGHTLELQRLQGHTHDDLVLIDHTTGVVFAGGLVFSERVPTTPHAEVAAWQRSLQTLRTTVTAHPTMTVVPSHGPVHQGTRSIDQTRDWLQWLDQTLRDSAQRGLDLGEVLQTPLPDRFRSWAALPAEFVRSVTHLYPSHELAVLPPATVRGVTPR